MMKRLTSILLVVSLLLSLSLTVNAADDNKGSNQNQNEGSQGSLIGGMGSTEEGKGQGQSQGTTTSGESGSTTSPGESGSTTTPGESGSTTSPGESGSTTSPGESGGTQSPGQEPSGGNPSGGNPSGGNPSGGNPSGGNPSGQEPSKPSEPEYTPIDETLNPLNVNIKEGTTGSIDTLLAKHIKNTYNIPSGYSLTTSGDTTSSRAGSSGTTEFVLLMANKDKYTCSVTWTIVTPNNFVFKTETQKLRATDSENSSANSLLSYVNKDLELVASGEQYESALGDGIRYNAAGFKWDNCDIEYAPYGGVTYVFSQNYAGNTVVRTVEVSSVNHGTPDVRINYNTNTLNGTNDKMQYSMDNKSWSNCKSNMPIQSSWYEKTLYFKYPATNNSPESGTCKLYIPRKAATPNASPKLEATSYSVTVTNCWDYDGAEFSIDKDNWYKSKSDVYTFKNLKAATSYTVYVRIAAVSGENLASEVKSSSIKTDEGPSNKLEVNYKENRDNATITATGTVASTISGKSISGSYPSSIFNKLTQIVNKMVKQYGDVDTEVKIYQEAEDGEYTDINSYSFNMNINGLSDAIKKANLKIIYSNDLIGVELDNDTLNSIIKKSSGSSISFNTQEPETINSYNSKWLKEQFDDGRPVYKVNTSISGYSGNVTYIIPYKIRSNESLGSLAVYAVNNSGKQYPVDYEYDTLSESFKASTNINGYITIVKEYSGEKMPFTDVKGDHWAYSYIKYCYNRGLFNGTSAYTFDPSLNINRAMIVTLLARVSNENLDNVKVNKNPFTDLKESDWYYKAAVWAQQNRYISGNAFDGEGTMTRGEIAALMYKLLVKEGIKDTGTNGKKIGDYYNDMNKQSSEVTKAVMYLYDNGIMIGVANKQFNPEGTVNRAQMAAMLYRLTILLDNYKK